MFLQNNKGLIYCDTSFSASKASYSSRGASLLIPQSDRNSLCQETENSVSFIESLTELSHNTVQCIMSITYNLTLTKCRLKPTTKITLKQSTKLSKNETAKKAEVIFSLIRYVCQFITGLQPQRERRDELEKLTDNNLTTSLLKMEKKKPPTLIV